MLDRDLVWGAVLFMRDKAKWTGNRFDIVLGGIKFSIQRRGRKVKHGDGVSKFSDTYLTRGDHGWVIIVRNFNFQNMTPMQPGFIGRRGLEALFERSEIDFEGDQAQFEHDYVMMRMFGDW